MSAPRAYARRMTELRTVRVAAVQATPAILDAPASVAKAAELIGKAAAEGAELVVLPETFVPLYPSGTWAKRAAGFNGFDELWERLWSNSVEVPGPLVDELVAACRKHGVHCAIGVNERELERPVLRRGLVLHPILAQHRCRPGDHRLRLRWRTVRPGLRRQDWRESHAALLCQRCQRRQPWHLRD